MRWKLILITVLILVAMPFFKRATNYVSGKVHATKVVIDVAKKAFK